MDSNPQSLGFEAKEHLCNTMRLENFIHWSRAGSSPLGSGEELV